MSSLNKCMLIGRLGKEPEVKFTNSGQQVANFSIATSEKWNDKSGQKQEKTEWHNIVIWGNLAEVAKNYLHKGSLAYFEGKLQTRSWEKDGVKRYTTEVVVFAIQLLDARKQDDGFGGGNAQSEAAPAGPEYVQDDLPF